MSRRIRHDDNIENEILKVIERFSERGNGISPTKLQEEITAKFWDVDFMSINVAMVRLISKKLINILFGRNILLTKKGIETAKQIPHPPNGEEHL